MDYRGRCVAITGGTGVLGSAVVASLIEAGAVCHVPYRAAAEAEAWPLRGKPGVHLSALGDLADEAAVERFYAGLPGLWASIHLAGGFAYASLADADKKLLMAQLETNLVSAYNCCRAAARVMAAGGAGGRIVNVAARPALEGRSGARMAAYTASKAAVAALTAALGEELAPAGILVNAVAPSVIDTPANRASMPKADHALWPKPAEIATTILFLASPANRTTRGAVVPVYGRS